MAENPPMLKQLPSDLSTKLRRKHLLYEDGAQSSEDASTAKALPPLKTRAWSALEGKPALSPSPTLIETKATKDDSFVEQPSTPKRPNLPRGLSLQTLQMPPRDISSSSTANLSTNLSAKGPLSPKLDSSSHYASAASVLPRRSRGLDFARACTNLHHSTLAEQSSPDTSPVIGGRGVNIPRKQHSGASGPESPMFPTTTWSAMGTQERSVMSSSVGSVNMLDSSSSSGDSSDEDMMRGEDEDTIHMTPQAYRTGFGAGPFNTSAAPSPGMDLSNPFSPAAANLMSFKRRQRHGRNTRKSSSSASIQSSMHSPGPSSPPLHKSIELGAGGNYFTKDKRGMESRRESLSLGTNDLHISDTTETDEGENRYGGNDALGIPIQTNIDDRRRVIGRAVTRRSNMLPKTKTFARIRAALQEESTPIDTESRREAEVIRQVMEENDSPDSNAPPSQPATTASSPYLMPITLGPSDGLEDLTEMMSSEATHEQRYSTSFRGHAAKKSAGPDFWSSVDDRMRTPPPFYSRGGSSGISEDVFMDTPASSNIPVTPQFPGARVTASPSRSSTPQPVPTAGEVTRKTLKRRRDDDLDPNMFKRRAVSPGLSLQNSPILPPSPAQREGGWWQAKANRESIQGHISGERATSGGSTNGNGGISKRVGLQGMTDTNDGLMNMSIE